MSSKRIALDRRVCVIRPGCVSIKPALGAVIFPAIGLAISIGLFTIIALFAKNLSVVILAAILIPAIIFFPLSAMGLFYSLFGNRVIIEDKKQSASFQQGALGLGLGIIELVPFWKVSCIAIEEMEMGETEMKGLRPSVDLRSFAIILIKTNGKRLPIGEVITPDEDDLVDEAFGRAEEVAESIAEVMKKPTEIRIELEDQSTEDQISSMNDQELS